MDLEAFVSSVVGRMAQGIRPNDPLTRMYSTMLRRFAEHALSQWSAVSASGLQCSIISQQQHGGRRKCQAPASGPCIGCGNLVCLAHAMASADDGSLFCKACVQQATGRSWDPGPGPGARADSGAGQRTQADSRDVLRKQYLKQMGLGPDVGLSDVKRRFKELSIKFHPDRLRNEPPEERARLEARYKSITQAYHWLVDYYEEAA